MVRTQALFGKGSAKPAAKKAAAKGPAKSSGSGKTSGGCVRPCDRPSAPESNAAGPMPASAGVGHPLTAPGPPPPSSLQLAGQQLAEH